MQFGDAQYYYGSRGVAYAQGASLPVGSAQPQVFNARAFKIYGAVLAMLAAATLSLGIANVVLTMEAYCNPWTTSAPIHCSAVDEPYVWTWVGSGIWGSVPIFFAGLFAMCVSSNPGKWTRVWTLLIFLSAIVFAPGICVLSSIEVWRGSESNWNFYKLSDGLHVGNIMPEDDPPFEAKFALPLVTAILAAIMFFMTAIVTLMVCCCMQSLGIYLPQEVNALTASAQVAQPVAAPQPTVIQSREVYYPTRPQVKNYYDIDVYRPASDPYARFEPPQTSVPTRYNPTGAITGNVMYGNFASDAQNVGNNFASDFFRPNPAYFWQ